MTPYYVCFHPLVVLVLLLLPSVTASSPYSPVTALDKFGNSQQLQHARQAALCHGRLVVAAKFQDSIVVVSVDALKEGSVQRDQVVEPVWTSSNKYDDKQTTTFLACTGIKADATFVIHSMRQYCQQLWERCNVDDISQERLTLVLSSTLLEFMGYNRAAELSDGIRFNNRKEEGTSWARPLGIQTMILTPSEPIVLVEPSGVAISYDNVCAIGKDSAQVMKLLDESSLDTMTTLEDFTKLLVDTLQRHCKSIEGKSTNAEIRVHVIDKHGTVRQDISPSP